MATLNDLTSPKRNRKSRKKPLQITDAFLRDDVTFDPSAFVNVPHWAVSLPNGDDEQYVVQLIEWPFDLKQMKGICVSFVDENDSPVRMDGSRVDENEPGARNDASHDDGREDHSHGQSDDDDVAFDVMSGRDAFNTLAHYIDSDAPIMIDKDAPNHRGIRYVKARLSIGGIMDTSQQNEFEQDNENSFDSGAE